MKIVYVMAPVAVSVDAYGTVMGINTDSKTIASVLNTYKDCIACNGTGSDCSIYPIRGCNRCDGYGKFVSIDMPA